MYNSVGLVPSRFLILVAHFSICVTLLWNSKESVRVCLPQTVTPSVLHIHHTQFVTGLSVAIGLMCFEFLAFIFGLTMFNSSSALLSVGGHAGSSIALSYFVMDSWHCGWFWWIFFFGSVVPAFYDFCEEISVERPGWTRILVIAGIATSIGCSLPIGYNIGVVNTPAFIIKGFCNESVYTRYDAIFDQDQLDLLWSSIVSVFLIGGAIGSLGGSVLADRIGRKGGLIVGSILGAVAAVLFFGSKSANSVEMLFIGRIFAGLSAGLITSIMPMYLTELSPSYLKGASGALCPLGLCTGVLLGQVMSMHHILGNEEYWPHCLAFFAIPLVICSAIIPVLPESPKYLFVIKKQPHLALKQLQRLRDVKESMLQEEIQALRVEEQENVREGESWNLVKVLTHPHLLLPLLLVCSLQAGQQFSGINAVFYYSSEIFKSAGLSRANSELATIGAGICNLFMAMMSLPILSKFSRRLILQISLCSSIFFLILLGLSIIYIDSNSVMPYICILGVLGFVICYGLGLGPIPYFIGSELFEVGPRPSAMALGSMANWGGNFFIGLAFPSMKLAIGASSFFIFAGVAIALLIFVRIYLPETKGRDACEIMHLVSNGFKSKPLQPHGDIVNLENLSINDKTYL